MADGRLVQVWSGTGDVFYRTITIPQLAPPSITSIPENVNDGINAAEASDGTPVVVSLAGTGALAGDTLAILWGARSQAYTLGAADIAAGSATVTVSATTIANQGNGTFGVTAALNDPAGNASGSSPAFSVTVNTAAPAAPSIRSIIENAGGVINSAEAANGTPVVVDFVGNVAGDTLTINWGSQTQSYG